MFKFFQYVQFLFTATNQHGVHSPFIYNYVTKCLYVKQVFRYSKSINVLLKSIDYFDIGQMGLPLNTEIQKTIRQHFPDVRFVKEKSELFWISANKVEQLTKLLSQINSFHNDSILFIDAIHASVENQKMWEKIKIHEKVRVTIDLFVCGIVFFRKEQAKEHFKIRI